MGINEAIFREYDIRGIVDRDLDEGIVERIGRGFGTILTGKGARSVALGRDVRHSSTGFSRAMAAGLSSTGLRVLDVGVVPTPVLYYAIIHEECDGGVMITGSHNPVEYNGIKLCDGPLAIYGEEIQELRRVVEAADFASGDGRVDSLEVLPVFEKDLLSRFRAVDPFHVVVDCGNGVAGPVIPDLLRAAGHRVDELYTDPDGSFPNHLPDPEVPEYMKDLVQRVKDSGADIGLGFDGDADRLGVIDENGRKISADWLVAIFARDILTRHPGGKVRFDVKCSDFLDDDIRAHGGEPVMGRTGHSILKRDMKELDAVLGGELSGHIVFGRDYYPIDDPFYSAFKILELMAGGESRSCSSLFDGIPETYSTAEIKAAVPDDMKFRIVEELVETFRRDYEVIDVDGARVVFDEGWGLVRASNTTANLTIRFEARSLAGRATIREAFLAALEKHPEVDLGNVRDAF